MENFNDETEEPGVTTVSNVSDPLMVIEDTGKITSNHTTNVGYILKQTDTGSQNALRLNNPESLNNGFDIGILNDGLTVKINQRENADLQFYTNNAEAMVIDSSGNIGIGSTNPGTLLDIEGDSTGVIESKITNLNSTTAATTRLRLNNDSGNGLFFDCYSTGYTTSGNTIQDGARITTNSALAGGLVIETGASHIRLMPAENVGIGITAPVSNLHIHQPGSSSVQIRLTDSDTGTTATDGFAIIKGGIDNVFLWNYEDADIAFVTNNTERMRITSTGNVGIGTTPLLSGVRKLLEVFDATTGPIIAVRFNTNSLFGMQASPDDNFMRLGVLSGNDISNALTINADSDIGIGVTNPQTLLEIGGTNPQLRISDRRTSSGGAADIEIGSIGFWNEDLSGVGATLHARISTVTDNGSVKPAGRINLETYVAGVAEVILTCAGADGFVGIGTETPLNKLDVDGDIVASGDITSFGTVSDRRLKNNIQNLEENNLDKIMSMRPVSFKWKDIPAVSEHKRNTNDKGFLAQEIEQIEPLLVGSVKLVKNEEHKKIYYEKMVTYLVGAMQEQQKMITKLQQEVAELKSN